MPEPIQIRAEVPSGEGNPWKGLVIYQIYPPSFLDSNGDGIGDLGGIEKKIHYLKSVLGVDAILLNPVTVSSGVEGGYDVKDYRDIDPQFGTLGDFERLLAACHKAGLKVVLDLVVNHTSDQHPWFQDVEGCRDSPYVEYYILRAGKERGLPPNNWVGNFGGCAWRFLAERNEWALHSFLPEQMDLNFRNSEVLQQMGNILEFWLEKGVDGVRLDSIPYTVKHPDLPNGQVNEHFDPSKDHPSTQVITDDKWFQPGMLEVLKYFTEIASRYPGRFMISESYPPPHLEREWVGKLYAAADGKVHAPLNSALISCPWDPNQILPYLDWFYKQLSPNDIAIWSIDNHDVYQRIASRVGEQQARVAAMLLLTLPGTPVIYCGDEIGMRSHAVPPELQRDVFRRFNPDTWRTRDPARLPMSWNRNPNGGFTRISNPDYRPWLPAAPDYKTTNVRQQLSEPGSILDLYRQLLNIRNRHPELSTGTFQAVFGNNPRLVAYRLENRNASSYVALNFSAEPQLLKLKVNAGRLLLNTQLDRKADSLMDLNDFELRADEGIIVKLK